MKNNDEDKLKEVKVGPDRNDHNLRQRVWWFRRE